MLGKIFLNLTDDQSHPGAVHLYQWSLTHSRHDKGSVTERVLAPFLNDGLAECFPDNFPMPSCENVQHLT